MLILWNFRSPSHHTYLIKKKQVSFHIYIIYYTLQVFIPLSSYSCNNLKPPSVILI